MARYVLFKPTVLMKHQAFSLAPRPVRLNTIGLLCNAKVNSDVYIKRIRELLAEKYPSAGFVFHKKALATGPMSEEALGELSGCDVVLNAFGD